MDVINCVILNMAGSGIYINAPSKSYIYQSIIAHSGNGIHVASYATITLDDDKITNNGSGVLLDGTMSSTVTYAIIKRTTISGNSDGVSTGGFTTTFINDSEITNNSGDGILTNAGTIYVDRTIISGNGTGLQNTGGHITSYENNDVNGNTAMSSGTITKSVAY